MPETRIEKDSMGEVRVPAEALWGAQTQRAVENFPISGVPLPPRFLHTLGLVKLAAARVNRDLKLLDDEKAGAIEAAAREVADGQHDGEFPIDVFQTGSGTSTNMNANEVLSNLASRSLGGELGSKLVHPNDHVNLGQSSNDVIPTTLHVAAVLAIEEDLIPALQGLQASLERKAEAFDDVVKIGRTHLMDAVPIRLGQEFSGYAAQVDIGIERLEAALPHLRELAIGGTAVGTGLNTHPEFGARVAAALTSLTGTEFVETRNHFEAQGAQDAAVFAAGAVNTVAASLMKIANDLRILGSGPRTGIGEIRLPAIQPGSSIMPGKVNPVLSESVVQVGAQVLGNTTVVTLGGQWGQLDLNTFLPVMARNLLESIALLANVVTVFTTKLVDGIEANEETCRSNVELSTAIVTALNPLIGYDRAAKIAKKAFAEGRTVREVAHEELDDDIGADAIDAALEPRKHTEPGIGD